MCFISSLFEEYRTIIVINYKFEFVYFNTFADDILDVIKSHDKTRSSLPNAICKKLYRCKSESDELWMYWQ